MEKPWFQPPDWDFGPVWTFLYASMVVSVLYAIRDSAMSTLATVFFISQLTLNLLWTPVFFGAERYLLAFVMLLGMIGFTIGYAWAVKDQSPTAAYVIIPYIVWLIFASIINLAYIGDAK